MKRLLIILLLLIVVPGTVAHATVTYSSDVTVSNNTTTAYTQMGVTASENVSLLVANGFITSTGLDTRVQQSGSDLPWMMATDRVTFAVPVPANSSNVYQFVTGQTAASSMQIVLGHGGYVTTNDTAALEHGANFTDEISAYINTSIANTILSSSTRYSIESDGAGNIEVNAVTPYPVIASTSNSTGAVGAGANITISLPSGYASGDLVIVGLGTSSAADTTITAPGGWTNLYSSAWVGGVIKQYAWYRVLGSSENASANWTTTAALTGYSQVSARFAFGSYSGNPVAGVVATAGAGNIDPPNLVSGFGNVPTSWLVFGTVNGAMAAVPAGYTSLITTLQPFGTLAYANITAASENPGTFTNGSTDWIGNTIAINRNILPLISLPVSTGLHTVTVREDSTHLWMTVDSTSSSNYTAVTISNTADNYVYGSNATAYFNYMKMTVGGNEVLWYQPVTIIQSTTLPDRDGTKDGDITWGTNPSGVSVTFGGLSSTTVITTNTTSSGYIGNFLSNNVSANTSPTLAQAEIAVQSDWLYLFIKPFADTSGTQAVWFYWFGTILFGVLGFVLAYRTKHLLISAIAFDISFAYGITKGYVPPWVIIVLALWTIGQVIQESKTG